MFYTWLMYILICVESKIVRGAWLFYETKSIPALPVFLGGQSHPVLESTATVKASSPDGLILIIYRICLFVSGCAARAFPCLRRVGAAGPGAWPLQGVSHWGHRLECRRVQQLRLPAPGRRRSSCGDTLSCSAARGTFPDQGSNPRLRPWRWVACHCSSGEGPGKLLLLTHGQGLKQTNAPSSRGSQSKAHSSLVIFIMKAKNCAF